MGKTEKIKEKKLFSWRRLFKRIFAYSILLFLVYYIFSSFFIFKKIVPTKIGILTKSINGKVDVQIKQGLVIASPFCTLYEFPSVAKIYTLSKKDSSLDNRIEFTSADGIIMNAQVYLEIKPQIEKLPELFNLYGENFDNIINEHISLELINLFIEKASEMEADSIMINQEFFIAEIKNNAVSKLKNNYVELINMGLKSSISLPKELNTLINKNVFERQYALQSKYTKERIEAETATAIAKNQQILDSVITKNKIKLYNQMVANDLRINQYMTDSTIYALEFTNNKLKSMQIKNTERAIEKWDGHLPDNTPSLKFPFNFSNQNK